MKETRRLTADALRALCIKRNWFTHGTNDEYSRLLDMAHNAENLTTDIILAMAKEITKRSITDYDLESICFEIAEASHTFFTIN